jgi:type VI secretion system protein VasJ
MLTDQIRSPISADAPCGRDVRHDDDFDSLKNEVGKQSAVGARTDFDQLVKRGGALVGGRTSEDGASTLVVDGGGVDFERVVTLATGILSAKSKDLQVAGYLCLGSFRTGGYAGLAESLECYQALLETWWDGLFPELRRLEGRRLAVAWVAQRVAESLALQPASSADRAPIEQAIATCRAVDVFLRERVPENPPSLSALARALTEVRDGLPAAPVAAPAAPAAGPDTPAASPAAVPAAPSVAPPQNAGDALLAVARAADLLRAAQPESPIGYRLLRCVRWDSLDGAPPDRGGVTMVQPPEDHFRTRLGLASKSANAREALGACEEIFYDSPNQYWLDLQRVVDQALGALGAPVAAVRRMLRHELARLLERVPGLEALQFADGTPFADGATREWIENEIRPLSSAGAASPGATSVTDDAALATELGEAARLAGDGDLPGALARLQAGQSSDARRRPRFLRQLAMARLCLAAGRASVARPLLEDLDRQIEHHGLVEWEPELCAQTWTLMQRCYQGLAEGDGATPEEVRSRMVDVFGKLCRLDVRMALAEGAPR